MPDRSRRLAPASLLPFALAAALAAPLAAPRARAQEEPPADAIEVHGTVIVETAEGAELDAETGRIMIVVRTPSGPNSSSGSPTEAWLIDGEFTLKVARNAQLEVQAFVLDDDVAYLLVDDLPPGGTGMHDEAVVAIPADGQLALRARIPPPTVLVVVDAESGEPLEGVEVLLDLFHDGEYSTMGSPHSLGERQLHPTPWQSSDFLARATRSPITLKYDTKRTFGSWSEAVWVHVPWRCWAGVAVDYRIGGEQRIELKPGGVVFGKVDQEVPKGTCFCLRKEKKEELSDNERMLAEFAAKAAGIEKGEGEDEGESEEEGEASSEEGESGFEIDFGGFGGFGDLGLLAEWPIAMGTPAKLDGIPAGTYRATLEIGERFGNRQTFAETMVTVVAGKPALANFALDGPIRAPEPVEVSGELRLAPGWEGTKLTLLFRPGNDVSPLAGQDLVFVDGDALERDPKQPGLLRARSLRLAPGSYQLLVDALGIEQTIRVARDAATFAIEVAAPVDATIRFVDSRTREPVEADGINWSVARKESDALADGALSGGFGFGFNTSSDDGGKRSEWKRRVPAGAITVRTVVEGYEWLEGAVVTVTPEQPIVEVALRHLTGVRATFRREGREADWDETIRASTKSPPTRGGRGAIYFSEGAAIEPTIEPLDEAPAAKAKGADDEEMVRDEGSWRSGHYWTVQRPGRYRVTFPPLEGFEPFPPFEVVVAEQQFAEVVLQLVPVKAK